MGVLGSLESGFVDAHRCSYPFEFYFKTNK